jgi:hypothetical protein
MHLTPRRGFFNRFVAAIKYIFGYRSSYGHWDNFIFSANDCEKMISYFERLKKNNEEITERYNSAKNGVKQVQGSQD